MRKYRRLRHEVMAITQTEENWNKTFSFVNTHVFIWLIHTASQNINVRNLWFRLGVNAPRQCWVIKRRKFRVERIDRQHRIKTSVVESRKKQKTGGTYFQRRKLNADGPPSWFDRPIGNESVIMFWSNVSLVNNNSHQKKALKNAISLQKLLWKKNIYRLTPPSVISFRSPWNHNFDSNQEATAIADPPLAKLDIEKTC
jgi:hypothetical protein